MTSKQLQAKIKEMDRNWSKPFPKGIEGSHSQNFRLNLEIAYQLALLNEKIAKGIGIRNA